MNFYLLWNENVSVAWTYSINHASTYVNEPCNRSPCHAINKNFGSRPWLLLDFKSIIQNELSPNNTCIWRHGSYPPNTSHVHIRRWSFVFSLLADVPAYHGARQSVGMGQTTALDIFHWPLTISDMFSLVKYSCKWPTGSREISWHFKR